MIQVPHRAPALVAAFVALIAGPIQAPIQGQVQAPIPVATEFDALHFRSIGPATMSGRVADVTVYEKNPALYYVGTAHGGVWKTTSNGALWTPLLQHDGLMSIGDVEMSQTNPNLVWVGTGESNNRQSTGWGEGVYKTTDGGVTFTHMGLRDTKHINRIIIDPTNNDIVYVAATGPLWGPGGGRGVYKTTDGGRNWRLVLRGDDDTGANDLVISPSDPRVLYASMYQRRRTNCCMNGGGPGSGIFKSTDGGETWNRLSGGLPATSLGRIGMDIFRGNASVLYASIEAPSAVPLDSGKTGLWRSDDAGNTWRKTNSTNPRPMYFSQVRIDPTNADRVYLGGVGMHMTIDGGKTIETDAARVTHDDVHAIWINPANTEHILTGNDGGIAVSYDRSRTWTFIPNLPVGLFYHVGFDNEMPYNICGGMQDNYNWCGPSASRHAAGIYNYDWFQILGGDGFVAIPDPRDSRWVYTESQDGNLIRRNIVTGESRSIRPNATNVSPAPATGDPAYRFHWDTPLIHGTQAGVLLVAANKVFRSTDRGDSWAVISPDLTRNGNRNDSTLFGVKNTAITIARNDGIQVWPTIVSLAESPKQAGVIWTGSDDGMVQVTRDGGATWTDVTNRLAGFPSGAYVSEVVPSRFDAGTAYVTVDDHRQNNYGAYVWVTTDFGATFRRIDGSLTGEVVHTLTEDTRNADVLYAGTESGIFLTLDRGASWRRLRANFPTVRVDEITIHPRDNAMLVASHGRAIWVLDHLEPIQEYAAAQAASVRLFSVPTALQWKAMDNRNDEFWGHQTFIGENPPTEAVISFHVKTPPQALLLRISSGSRVIREIAVPAAKNTVGIQTVCWDQRLAAIVGAPAVAGGFGGGGGGGGSGGGQFGAEGGNRTPAVPGVPVALPDAGYKPLNPCAVVGAGGPGGGGGFGGGSNAGPYATPGDYTVSLVADGNVVDTKPMRIVMDPEVEKHFSGKPRVAYDKLVNDIHAAQQRGQNTATRLTALAAQVAIVDSKIDSSANVTPEMKAAYAAFKTTFNDVRAKFGVQLGRVPGTAAPSAAGGQAGAGGAGGPGGGQGGFGGAAAGPNSALGRVGQMKGLLLGVWEAPSAASVRQATDATKALDQAIEQADALLARVSGVNNTLKPSGLAITLP